MFSKFPTPYWSAPSAALYVGDVRECLKKIPARSVHCVITSPPYWGLRDYGTGTWEGGSAECDHMEKTAEQKHKSSTLGTSAIQRKIGGGKILPATNAAYKSLARQYVGQCLKCGACRTDQQLGNEPLSDCGTYGQSQCGSCFVCSMVSVFRSVYRVLRDDGTLWLNLGDTFDNGQSMIPALVALALRKDEWKLVQDIIWYSPNKMPESVTSRCSKAHEHIFLMAKTDDYYFDSIVIQEEGKSGPLPRLLANGEGVDKTKAKGGKQQAGSTGFVNKRDVWIVPTQGYPGTHYATFSPKLITPCIQAGTSEHGVCGECGRQYERLVVKRDGASIFHGGTKGTPPGQNPQSDQRDDTRDRSFAWSRNGKPGTGLTLDGIPLTKETIGWQKMCGCHSSVVSAPIVLDPFVGSGTTVATALELGRAGIGIDLSQTYIDENAIPRINSVSSGIPVPRNTVAVPSATRPAPRRLD